MSNIVALLPYPPSVNDYWRNAKNGKHKYIKKEGKIFREQVGLILRKFKPVKGQVKLKVLLAMPDNRVRDIDNILKALLDAINHANKIDDDESRILHNLTVERVGNVSGGGVIIKIEPKVKDVTKKMTIEEFASLLKVV